MILLKRLYYINLFIYSPFIFPNIVPTLSQHSTGTIPLGQSGTNERFIKFLAFTCNIMWFLRQKQDDDYEKHTLSRMHNALTLAFNHVKSDISNIFSWIHYFHRKHQEHDEKLAHYNDRLLKVEQQLRDMPKSHQEIKQIVDYYYSYEDIFRRINELSQRLSLVEQQRVERRVSGRERLVQKIAKNSKDYVKTVITSLIKKYGRISAPQLKEIVIGEQGLCSKSSFYRILEELENEGEIEHISAGKEKIYTAKAQLVK